MFENTRMRLYGTRYATVAMMILALLVVAPLAAATGPEDVGRFSGDDAYDPAAGGRPELSVAAPSEPSARSARVSFSGDDPYDPAAGGKPELSLILAARRSSPGTEVSYSGDDPYDPAAGGWAGLDEPGFVVDLTPSVGCGLSADEIAERSARTVAGGFSGDDAYDAAAGGMPELSLLPFADASDLLAGCEFAAGN
jgi:hypothetical protein